MLNCVTNITIAWLSKFITRLTRLTYCRNPEVAMWLVNRTLAIWMPESALSRSNPAAWYTRTARWQTSLYLPTISIKSSTKTTTFDLSIVARSRMLFRSVRERRMVLTLVMRRLAGYPFSLATAMGGHSIEHYKPACMATYPTGWTKTFIQ